MLNKETFQAFLVYKYFATCPYKNFVIFNIHRFSPYIFDLALLLYTYQRSNEDDKYHSFIILYTYLIFSTFDVSHHDDYDILGLFD